MNTMATGYSDLGFKFRRKRERKKGRRRKEEGRKEEGGSNGVDLLLVSVEKIV